MNHTTHMELISRQENERRTKFRFGIKRQLRYKVMDEGVTIASGAGQTIDIGSGGVSFIAEHLLEPGAFVEVAISWPALLGETCPMRLIVVGRVLRSMGHKAVCSIDRYEYRTQARLVVHTVAAARSAGLL